MLQKFKFICPTILLVVLFLTNVNAQVRVFSKNGLKRVKAGKTHLVVWDWDFPGSPEYFKVIKKYWTITKSIDFIKESALKDNLVKGDSYLSIVSTLHVDSNTMVRVAPQEMQRFSTVYFYLNFWVPSEAALKKKHVLNSKPFNIAKDEVPIAQVQMSVDSQYLNNAEKLKNGSYVRFDFDGGGHVANWNPGAMKNYIEQLNYFLHLGKKVDISDDIDSKDDVTGLKEHTIFCPEDDFPSTQSLASKTAYLKLVFEGYHYNVRILSTREFQDKILDAEDKPFYYLLFLHNTPVGKVFAIINSTSGIPVYQKHKASNSAVLRPGDLDDLITEIQTRK